MRDIYTNVSITADPWEKKSIPQKQFGVSYAFVKRYDSHVSYHASYIKYLYKALI